ncbi:TULIP family P47-like protein [Nitrosopumilus sp.]|uniref:TULIP family P47-like protein n=1 Tax=Nitrosopumilus sp. TaxID=2024843 RepID=UPI0026243B47|nr:TULIP family P47-like protein [Nitrosopumilus sp.]
MNYLHGWDTVYAVSINKTNQQLASSFTNTTFDLPSSDLKLSGTFGAWSIVTGGASTLLHLETQVTKGTFNLPGVADNVDLSGVSFVFEISLQLLPSKTNPIQHDLSFNVKKISSVTSTTTTPLVTPVSTIDPKNKLTQAVKRVLPPLMAVAINNQAATIGYVFANINLVKPGTGSWLTPVQADYAYLELQSTPPRGYLCILTVTDDRDISAYKRIVDPSIISGQNNAGFFISQELFLKNIVMPSLPGAFHTGNSFTLGSDNVIRMAGVFALPDVNGGLATYHPKCTSISVSIQQNQIVTTVNGTCDLYWGLCMNFTIIANYPSAFNPTTQSISFTTKSSPNAKYTYPCGTPFIAWKHLLDLICSTILLYVAGNLNELNASSSLMNPRNIHWSGMQKITITNAGLNNLFFMEGEFDNVKNQKLTKMTSTYKKNLNSVFHIVLPYALAKKKIPHKTSVGLNENISSIFLQQKEINKLRNFTDLQIIDFTETVTELKKMRRWIKLHTK